MAFKLPNLPYAYDALEPYMIKEQWSFITTNITIRT